MRGKFRYGKIEVWLWRTWGSLPSTTTDNKVCYEQREQPTPDSRVQRARHRRLPLREVSSRLHVCLIGDDAVPCSPLFVHLCSGKRGRTRSTCHEDFPSGQQRRRVVNTRRYHAARERKTSGVGIENFRRCEIVPFGIDSPCYQHSTVFKQGSGLLSSRRSHASGGRKS